MIYVMMFRNREGQLGAIRYDTASKMYAYSAAVVPPGYEHRAEYPNNESVLLAHEVSAVEQTKEGLGAVPGKEGSTAGPAMWLKTLGTFQVLSRDTMEKHEHAYEFMENLISSASVPQFFQHVISQLTANGVLGADGERNPEQGDVKTLLTAFGGDDAKIPAHRLN
jgi:hypothetical protein